MSTKQFLKNKANQGIWQWNFRISDYQKKEAYKILEENVINKGLIIKTALNFSKATAETTTQWNQCLQVSEGNALKV